MLHNIELNIYQDNRFFCLEVFTVKQHKTLEIKLYLLLDLKSSDKFKLLI
jgi:hypothetical protein